jgi:hypothetical protein
VTYSEPAQLDRAWAVLSTPTVQELSSFPLDVTSGAEPCRVALDRTGGRHLLVPAAGETVAVDSRPAVLAMAVRKLRFGGPAVQYVDVSCGEAELFAEFDDVVADVLDAVADAPKPASAAVRTVARWRRLFRNSLVRGLSRQAKLGLFAELTVLAALVDADPAFLVDMWRGPLREPHDFEAPNCCIEVKGLGVASDALVVHGLDQLGRHDGKDLVLVLVRVVEDPDGSTVTELVEQIRETVSSRADFRSRLAAAGWSSGPDRPDFDRYAVDEVLQVTVGPETPGITPDDLVTGRLPDGVRDLTYAVELAALLPLASGASLEEIAERAVR